MTVSDALRVEVAEREALVGNVLVEVGRAWQLVRDDEGRLRLSVGRRYGALLDGCEVVLSPDEVAVLASALGASAG